MDVIGPFPATPEGNRYIAIFVDYCTHFPMAAAVADVNVRTILAALQQAVITEYGAPRELLVEKGSIFEGRSFRRMVVEEGVRRVDTIPNEITG